VVRGVLHARRAPGAQPNRSGSMSLPVLRGDASLFHFSAGNAGRRRRELGEHQLREAPAQLEEAETTRG
jgi:hypothetical protein